MLTDDPQKAALLTQLALVSLSSAQLRGLQQPLQAVLPTTFETAATFASAPAGLLLPPSDVPALPAPPARPAGRVSLFCRCVCRGLGSLCSLARPFLAGAELLTWLRDQEGQGTLSADEATRLEHIAASASHAMHEELKLHWLTFGQRPADMVKSAKRILQSH